MFHKFKMMKIEDTGFRIKKIRELQNITQDDLAVKLDVSQSTLSKIENGKIQKIDYRLLRRICKFFEIEIDDLISEEFCFRNLKIYLLFLYSI